MPNELVADTRKFLEEPTARIEIGQLVLPPDLALLKWLPTLKGEIGLVYQVPTWYAIKGADEQGIPAWAMPSNSDILIHSHNIIEDSNDDDSIPSLGDFRNSSPRAKNLIVSQKGITEYWTSPTRDSKRNIDIEMQRWRFRFGPGTAEQYLAFLDENGLKFSLVTWDYWNDEKLKQFLLIDRPE